MITIKEQYLARVQIAAESDDLHAIHADMGADPRLHSTDKDEIADAIQARFGELNAQADPPADHPRWSTRIFRRGCKHLITIFLLATFAVVPGIAPALQGTSTLVTHTAWPVSASKAGHPCMRQSPAAPAIPPRLGRRLAALSQIESGDDDDAVGRFGEISRYQILPPVWRGYFLVRPDRAITAAGLAAAARNPFTARNVAAAIMQHRCARFETRFHRAPTDEEFYLLWARPSWLLSSHAICRCAAMTDRAQRFANLVNR